MESTSNPVLAPYSIKSPEWTDDDGDDDGIVVPDNVRTLDIIYGRSYTYTNRIVSQYQGYPLV